MKMTDFGKKVGLGASALMLAMGMQTAQAVPVSVKLVSGADTVICADGDSCDADSATGSVTYVGNVGSFIVNVTTALTAPLIGSADTAQLRMTNNSVTSSAGGTIEIYASGQNYSGPISAGATNLGYDISVNNNGGTIASSYWLADSNALFAEETLLGAFGASSGLFTAAGGTTVSPVSNPFSLTIKTVITHTSGTTTGFSADIPEPSLLALMGVGLLGLGLVGFGRRGRHGSTMVAA